MIGNLEPEERDTFITDNSGIGLHTTSKLGINTTISSVIETASVYEQVSSLIKKFGWENDDEISVEMAGTQVSGIDVGDDYNPKWSSPIGTRKINKDAFIVIKNQSRRDLTKSQPNPDLKAHHA